MQLYFFSDTGQLCRHPAGYMNIDTESIDGKYYGIFRNICNFSLNKCYHVSAHLSLTVV